jgi:hypothetical protein
MSVTTTCEKDVCEKTVSALLAAVLIGAMSLSSGCSLTDRKLTSLDAYEFPSAATVESFCNTESASRRPKDSAFEYAEVCARLDLGRQAANVPQAKRTIGLALSGGGSKSAPFEIGVLAGLEDAGVLEKVDYISSVSGGSYAALYFYSHLLAQFQPASEERTLTRKTMFFDCLPSKYASMFTPSSPPANWSIASADGICPDPIGQQGRYWPLSSDADPHGGDPLREASHLRGYQPIFDDAWAYDKYNGTLEDHLVLGEAVGKLGVNIAALSVPNFFLNTVFDTRVDLGYIKRRYDDGIARTYGETANDLTLEPSVEVRTRGNPAALSRLTFENLKKLYVYSNGPDCSSEHQTDGLCHTPLWIINATAGTSRGFFPLLEFSAYSAQANGFEFTAFGYGSSLYGRRVWGENELEPPGYTVVRAVAASSAFLDNQQRQVGGSWGPFVNVAVLHLANLDWGDDIPNYHRRTRTQYRELQVIHDLLPWPFYFLNYEKESNDSLYIHLSDGGMSEDLGTAALLRRHVTDIMVVDASADPLYQLGDLCVLNTQLQNDIENRRGVFIDVPGRPNHLLTGCDTDPTVDPFGIKDTIWQPVIRGRVCKLDGRACTDDDAEARLYILKPALNLSASAPGGTTLAEARANATAHQLRYADCDYASNLVDVGYPCEVVGYLADPVTAGYPQDDIYAVTLASNAYIFGAYKELGRFYARHLRVDDQGQLITRNQW